MLTPPLYVSRSTGASRRRAPCHACNDRVRLRTTPGRVLPAFTAVHVSRLESVSTRRAPCLAVLATCAHQLLGTLRYERPRRGCESPPSRAAALGGVFSLCSLRRVRFATRYNQCRQGHASLPWGRPHGQSSSRGMDGCC